MRLGDSRIIPIDIRVIAATNKNLEDLVRAGKFRQDLYYRLYVLQLNIPPLRERKEDIPASGGQLYPKIPAAGGLPHRDSPDPGGLRAFAGTALVRKRPGTAKFLRAVRRSLPTRHLSFRTACPSAGRQKNQSG